MHARRLFAAAGAITATVALTLAGTGLASADDTTTDDATTGSASLENIPGTSSVGVKLAYAHDTNLTDFTGLPVLALPYSTSIDSNPVDNVAFDFAPTTCGLAPEQDTK